MPCTWRPGYSFDNDTCQRPGSTRSLASTAASEDDLNDLQAAPSNDGETQDLLPPKKASFLNPEAAEFQMPTYETQVPMTKPMNPSGIRLNPEARAFEPMPVAHVSNGLPAEISTVINAAKLALSASPHVTNVKVTEGALGQASTIVAEINDAGPYGVRETLSSAKAALLGAAARSQITYVLGWNAMPFQDMTEEHGFKGVIGSVPIAMQDTICWDTYQKGYCPRRTLCRWCHPLEIDLAPLRVYLRECHADTGHSRASVPPMEM